MPDHVWHGLCESVSSRSAICPRPGSLIREESCGKVCVPPLGGPCSHYSCLLAGGGGGGGATTLEGGWALSHTRLGLALLHADIVKMVEGEEVETSHRYKKKRQRFRHASSEGRPSFSFSGAHTGATTH